MDWNKLPLIASSKTSFKSHLNTYIRLGSTLNTEYFIHFWKIMEPYGSKAGTTLFYCGTIWFQSL